MFNSNFELSLLRRQIWKVIGLLEIDVELKQESSKIVSILGANGAGKTTLLDSIAGAVVSTGSITLDGQELNSASAFRRARLGVRRSFQSSLLVDELSVLDNVRLGLDADGSSSEKDDAAMESLAALQLEQMADVPASRLVNVERRLVGLARCFAAKPKVLLLDEPGAGLVTHEKDRLVEAITTVASTFAKSIVLIEHDMDFVSATCPTVAVLNFGELLTAGPTTQVLDDEVVRAAYLGEGSS